MRLAPPRISLVVAALAAALSFTSIARAADLRIGIMQAQAGEARKYQPLLQYLSARGIPAAFVTATDYRHAADLFAAGKLDAMFSGSGIAGTMILKGLAEPSVRPVGEDGVSTYSAVVVAPSGAPRFDGSARYFDGKRVIFSPLASAGEFFFHALGASKPAAILKAASHGAAIDALSRGQADVAVVKNHVWTKEKAKFPGLALVGGDSGENPDNTLIVSRKLDAGAARKLGEVLLGLEKDASPEAAATRESLKIRRFIPTGRKEFAHTLELLGKAGVTKDFGFSF
jgi:ABC-type phosphate/phosphonate transport system substrate-binding protein